MPEYKNEIALLLGGNLGDIAKNFAIARQLLSQDFAILRQSSLYKTEAWGMENAPDFLNQVVIVGTPASPQQILEATQQIEQELGRTRMAAGSGYRSRIIDVDILSYDEEVINTADLKIPHPRLHERNFTLAPMLEVMPQWRHPLLNKTVEELWQSSTDENKVIKL